MKTVSIREANQLSTGLAPVEATIGSYQTFANSFPSLCVPAASGGVTIANSFNRAAFLRSFTEGLRRTDGDCGSARDDLHWKVVRSPLKPLV